jgi:hypothetical protein
MGNKWFGTWGGGVTKFDGSGWTTYNNINGIVNTLVNDLKFDDMDNLWIATDGGISNLVLNTTGKPATSKIRMCIYPNPVKEILSVTLKTGSSENALFSIHSPDGKIVLRETKHLSQASDLYKIRISSLSSGLYILTVRSKTLNLHQKFIVLN